MADLYLKSCLYFVDLNKQTSKCDDPATLGSSIVGPQLTFWINPTSQFILYWGIIILFGPDSPHHFILCIYLVWYSVVVMEYIIIFVIFLLIDELFFILSFCRECFMMLYLISCQERVGRIQIETTTTLQLWDSRFYKDYPRRTLVWDSA